MSSIADFESSLVLPPDGRTRLVARPDDKQKLTDRRETDCRTALARGLKEYLEQLRVSTADGTGAGGREIRFNQVLQTWAESEVPTKWPAAIVYALEAGTYDADSLSPSTFDLGSGLTIRQVAEFTQNLVIEIWATDPIERMALVGMLEDALDPVDWMTGLRLELPHYHNARATFEKTSMAYLDTADDAQRRWRKAAIVVQGNVPQFRRLGEQVPRLRIKLDLEAVGPEVDVTVPNGG